MTRAHLLEIHEQPWFPEFLRDAVTDVLQFILNLANYYQLVAPLLKPALDRAAAQRVVDLCSGGGGPWLALLKSFEDHPVSVCLTDKFPNLQTFQEISSASQQRIHFCSEPIEAERVPAVLHGFRTLFNSFHHFRPENAREIIRSAVETRQGLGIFEVPRRSFPAILTTCLMGIGTLLFLPFIRPFRFSLFVMTYLIPVLPFVLWFDGMVSCLRAYTPAELQQLAASVSPPTYRWTIGVAKRSLWPVSITYLIGYPVNSGYSQFEPSRAPH
jgi:hypothetical protein